MLGVLDEEAVVGGSCAWSKRRRRGLRRHRQDWPLFKVEVPSRNVRVEVVSPGQRGVGESRNSAWTLICVNEAPF